MWGPLRHLVGLTNDAADADGNVLARLRFIINNFNTGVWGGGGFQIFTTTNNNWVPPTGVSKFICVVRNGGQAGMGGFQTWDPGTPDVWDGSYLVDPGRPAGGSSFPAAAGAVGATSMFELIRLRNQNFTVTVGAGGTSGGNLGGTSNVTMAITGAPSHIRVNLSAPIIITAPGANSGNGGTIGADIPAGQPGQNSPIAIPGTTDLRHTGGNGDDGFVVIMW